MEMYQRGALFSPSVKGVVVCEYRNLEWGELGTGAGGPLEKARGNRPGRAPGRPAEKAAAEDVGRSVPDLFVCAGMPGDRLLGHRAARSRGEWSVCFCPGPCGEGPFRGRSGYAPSGQPVESFAGGICSRSGGGSWRGKGGKGGLCPFDGDAAAGGGGRPGASGGFRLAHPGKAAESV